MTSPPPAGGPDSARSGTTRPTHASDAQNPTQAPYRSPARRSLRSALSRRSTHASTAWGGVEREKEGEGKREEPESEPGPRRGSGLRLLSFFLLLLLSDPRLLPAAALHPPRVQRAARLPPAPPLPRRPQKQRRREAAAALRLAVPGPSLSRRRPAALSDTRRAASGRRHQVGGRGEGGRAGSEGVSPGTARLGPARGGTMGGAGPAASGPWLRALRAARSRARPRGCHPGLTASGAPVRRYPRGEGRAGRGSVAHSGHLAAPASLSGAALGPRRAPPRRRAARTWLFLCKRRSLRRRGT